jgi:hypothetical protein
VKREAMSEREREEDKQARRIGGPSASLRDRMSQFSYSASRLDNGKLKLMIFGGQDLPGVRDIEADMRDLDADKIKYITGQSIIIPCKAKSGNCVQENIGVSYPTKYRKSAMLTINLTNFIGDNIPTKLLELFSEVIKLAQTNPT